MVSCGRIIIINIQYHLCGSLLQIMYIKVLLFVLYEELWQSMEGYQSFVTWIYLAVYKLQLKDFQTWCRCALIWTIQSSFTVTILMRAPTLTQQVDVKILSARIACVVALASEHSVLGQLFCVWLSVQCKSCGSILSLVQISFPLFQTHYHILPYPKTKENQIYTKDKIEPQHIDIFLSSTGTCALLNLIRLIRYILIVPHFNMWDFVRNGDQIF